MNQYLLTYFYCNQFLSTVVDAQGVADIIGRNTVPSARNFRVYKITPHGVIPMRLSGTISAVTVAIYDSAGTYVESATFKNE